MTRGREARGRSRGTAARGRGRGTCGRERRAAAARERRAAGERERRATGAAGHRATGPRLLVAALGALLLTAGPAVSALGSVRSARERARPHLVADLVGAPLADALRPVVRQRGPRDCGPAALATVLAWRGRPAGEEAVLRVAHLRADGVTLAELARLAGAFELPGRWYAVPPHRLGSLPTPFLAHLRGGHYVAVDRRVGDFVLLADPARGLVLERRARFVRAWSGRVLLFDAAFRERGTAPAPTTPAPTTPAPAEPAASVPFGGRS